MAETPQFLRYKIARKQPGKTLALHLSDLHFKKGSFGDPTEAKARGHLEARIRQVLNGRQLDLIIVTGDVIDSENWDAKAHKETLERARDYLIKLCAKFSVDVDGLIVIGGNHDFKWHGIQKRKFGIGPKGDVFFNGMLVNFNEVFPDYDRHRLYEGQMSLLMGCFDSNQASGPVELATGVAKIEQIDGLRAEVDKLLPYEKPTHRIALIHHHPLPVPASEILTPQNLLERTIGRVLVGSPEAMMMKNSGIFLNRLLKENFSLVLHGHLHCENYWGPLYGSSGGNWLEVISGASFCDCNGQRSFGLLEIDDDGCLSYQRFWTTSGGHVGESPPMPCVDYERVRERKVSHLLQRQPAPLRCRRIHKMWEVMLPDGDVFTTEVFDGLTVADGALAKTMEIESWASTLTRQTFDAKVVGNGPAVTVKRALIKKPDNSDGIKYTLEFSRPLGPGDEITLVCQRSTVGAVFSSRDAQRFWGFPSSELGHDTVIHPVKVPCDELLISLRFDVQPPGGIDLTVDDATGNSAEAEQKLWRQRFHYWSGSNIGLQGRVTGSQLSLAIRKPLPHHDYALTWQVPKSEPIANLSSLRNIREQMLSLKMDPARLAAAANFLAHCLDEIRDQIAKREKAADSKDKDLHAYLFTVDAGSIREGESEYHGATMRCVCSTSPDSSLAQTPLLWGRAIVGRAARRSHIVSFDRSQLEETVEVLHGLPDAVQFLMVYPLYCYIPDRYPSAVLAFATKFPSSGLGVIANLVGADNDTDEALLAPLQALWTENFTQILHVAPTMPIEHDN
jgi:hypothetical protein